MKLMQLLILTLCLSLANEPVVLGSYMEDTPRSSTTTINYRVDLNLLKSSASKSNQSFVLKVDEQTTLTFLSKKFTVTENDNDFSWVGESSDKKAKIIITVRKSAMFGTLFYNNETYKISPQNGEFEILKVDPSNMIPFGVDTIEPKSKIQMPLPQKIHQTNDTKALEPNERSIQKSVVTDTTVKLLIYYTQALEDVYGTDTEAIIQANIDLANEAYSDSDTNISLETVALKKVSEDSLLSSADSSDLSDLLTKLRSDGVVRYEREYYNADAVSVFSYYSGGDACGLGYAPTDSEDSLVDAYAAVHIKPASEGGVYCSDLTFAHELGHNFGCFHDSDHVSSGTPMYTYAYGYDILNEFGTIMSYDGPEIAYFSNPTLSHTNTDTQNTNTIGDEQSADNARAIRENSSKMTDNSDEISEALEAGDTLVENAITGTLESESDRDGYVLWLEGETTFVVDNPTYSNNPFFLNLYNEQTHELITSFSDDETTMTLSKGQYRVTYSFSNDEYGQYYSLSTIDYTTTITTQYVAPSVNPSVILYLLH